jgi:hypothetical protein
VFEPAVALAAVTPTVEQAKTISIESTDPEMPLMINLLFIAMVLLHS